MINLICNKCNKESKKLKDLLCMSCYRISRMVSYKILGQPGSFYIPEGMTKEEAREMIKTEKEKVLKRLMDDPGEFLDN